MTPWYIRVGDTWSQGLGQWIPCKINGEWTTWCAHGNESVSGASDRHALEDGILWPRRVIDRTWVAFGGKENHCRSARRADEKRAKQTVETEIRLRRLEQ